MKWDKVLLVSGTTLLAFIAIVGCGREPTAPASASSSQVASNNLTFNKDVAPLVYENCSDCHRPGESAPFNLLTYEDVSKRAVQIAEVVESAYMPPWQPVEGYGVFAHERRLTSAQRHIVSRWVEQGSVEGNVADLPPTPQFPDGWQLGEPDLIVEIPETYLLRAEGRDVYRNFAIPIPVSSRRYVRAMELRPGNRVPVHHAFVLIDSTGSSRRLQAEDSEPGYSGMDAGEYATSPNGQFISWQPGKTYTKTDPAMAWTLNPGTDLVLQMHLQPTGKPENITAKIGLYFTEMPPTKVPFKIAMRRVDLDIPAGESQHVVQDTYDLPTDVHALAVLPHAHYLGKKVECFVLLPGGHKQWLLRIDQWDFNWQGDYSFEAPVHLPKGSRIVMRWTYDNSANNSQNQHSPPKRVTYGLQSTDEMGELWIQVLPTNPADRSLLARDQLRKLVNETVAACQSILNKDPNDLPALLRMGKLFVRVGQPAKAIPLLSRAVRQQLPSADTANDLGVCYLRLQQLKKAEPLFRRAIDMDPLFVMPRINLGMVLFSQRKYVEAEEQYRHCLDLESHQSDAQIGLASSLASQGKLQEAIPLYEEILRVHPERSDVRENLNMAKDLLGR